MWNMEILMINGNFYEFFVSNKLDYSLRKQSTDTLKEASVSSKVLGFFHILWL